MARIVVLGGYGVFGGRVAERLAGDPNVELVIAGRSLQRASEFAARLQGGAKARVTATELDALSVARQDLAMLRPLVVINASGPYQQQDYRLARACIEVGAHYLDLADARAFVTGIGVLDAEAGRAGVLVASGASTVPAVAAAVIDEFAGHFAAIEAATIVIAPGNSFDPGLATTQSILGSLGRPFPAPSAKLGISHRAYGWQQLERRVIPGLGPRWLGACETPDLDLFPQRYPGLKDVRVFAALEVGAFHLGLWCLSWLVRGGIVRQPERLAAPLLRVKHTLGFLGSDVGGMVVTLQGKSPGGASKRIDWHLVARSGHGPYVPTIASVILAKRLLAGAIAKRGAMPCVGLFALAEFNSEVADLDITTGST